MDEFLEKLREDQRRMRKFLQAQAMRFKRMGEALAITRERNARIFVGAEDPLSGLSRVIAEEYLAQLPALALELGPGGPEPESASDSASGEEVEHQKFAGGAGPPPRAQKLARHFRSGDVLLIFAHRGEDPTTKALLGFAKMRGVYAILIGGLDAKSTLRKAADSSLLLPTRGVKTVCEGSLLCARILARCARAALKSKAGADDEGRLIKVECKQCSEAVFVEERYRGKKGQCPLCRGKIEIPSGTGGAEAVVVPDDEDEIPTLDELPEDAADPVPVDDRKRPSRRTMKIDDEKAPLVAKKDTGSPPPSSGDVRSGDTRKGKRPLKPSVLEIAAPDLAALAAEEGREAEEAFGVDTDSPEPDEANLIDAASRRMPAHEDPDRPPVGLESGRQLSAGKPAADEKEPSQVQIAPEDVAFDEIKNATDSADPFGLPDGFVQDLVMPQTVPPPAPPPAPLPGRREEKSPALVETASERNSSLDISSLSSDGTSSRLVSGRFTAQDCRLRFGRGGYPDGTSPEHALEKLTPNRLAFRLNPEDEAGGTLEKGDEIWIRLEVPAFLEPVLLRGAVLKIGGSSGGKTGSQVELSIGDLDPITARKLARAAESLVAT